MLISLAGRVDYTRDKDCDSDEAKTLVHRPL